MPAVSSPKRGRKMTAKKRSAPVGRAKKIAARTVKKVRARSGETRSASRKVAVRAPKSPARRAGQRSRVMAQGPTREQLYQEARRKKIAGRSMMNKQQLSRALGR